MSITAFQPIAGVPSMYGTPGTLPLRGPEPGGGGALMASGDIERASTAGYAPWLEYDRIDFAGAEPRTFGDDWYDRLHLSTALITLGNVISEQVRQVRVWNAYRRAHTLAAINATGTEGLTLTGQTPPPIDYAPLQERTYTLTVSTSGPPEIDATYTFDFAPYDLVLEITGSRIIAWAFAPDWSRGILERLEWKTDVITHYGGSEQRRKVRTAPRKRYEFEAFFIGADRRYAEALIFGWGGRTWALPIWPDGQDVLEDTVSQNGNEIRVSTATRDYVAGGYAIVIADPRTYEIAEITEVLADRLTLVRPIRADWPAGTCVYPVRIARLADTATLTRWDGRASGMRALFDIENAVDYAADAGATNYRGIPVLERKPNWTGPFELDIARKISVLDNQSGVRGYEDESGVAATTQRMRWTMTSRAEQDMHRKMLYALCGRLAAMWVPTWEDDLVLASLISEASQTMDIEWASYTLQIGDTANRRDIRIQLKDGTVFYRRVVNAFEVDSAKERIGIDAPLGRIVAPADVAQICFMALCRLDHDAVEIAHWTGEVCETPVTFRSYNNDV